MTEKQIKLPNKKGKNVKAKKELAKKVVPSDSEFSDSNEMETSEKDIKKISADVSQMLANLKKEHGLEDDDGPVNKKKKPNEDKNKAKADPVKQPKTKPEAKNAAQKNHQQQQQQPGNQQQKKKNEAKKPLAGNKQKGAVQQKQPDISKNGNKKEPNNAQVKKDKKNKVKLVKEEPNTDVPAAGKKKKNKKAKQQQNAQETATEDVAVKKEPPNKESATKQLPKKKNPKKNENPKINSEVVADGSDDKKPAAEEMDAQKKDYYLKDASPICVTNLPTNIKRKQVLQAFKKFGKVLAIRFRTNTGKSYLSKAQLKGVPFVIAFIYFDTLDAAKASLVMNNEIFHDNKISVDLDSRDITDKVQPKRTILVGNLKYAVTQALLHETFSCCGKIEHIRVIQTNRGCNGVAFICFESPDSVALALELDKTSLLDRPMHVERYKEAKLKRSNKIQLKTVKKLKIKNKNNGAVNKLPTNNNTPIQGKSPNKKQKPPKEGKKKNKEFQGVKSNESKKAQLTKSKKKKSKMHHDKRMALKIAPKENKPDNAN